MFLLWFLIIGVVVLFTLNGLLYRKRRSSFDSSREGKEDIGYRQNSNIRSNWPF